MKKCFVMRTNYANAYRVAATDDVVTSCQMLAEGWERITLKEANALCKRERERRRDEPMSAGYASAKIETAYLNADGMIVCA